jgi:Fe2+ or Zn2+ uptake regulation protein
LSTFESHGLVERIHAFDDRARFDANISSHQHLVCIRCQSIQDLDWEVFEGMEPPAQVRKWGEVKSKHAVLRGICSDCLKKERKKY